MDGYARFIVRMGWFLVAFPFLEAMYVWFAIPGTLARHNASDMAQETFRFYLSESIEWSVAFIVLGATSMVAGKRILARRRSGWNLWLVVCSLFLSLWLLDVAVLQQPSLVLVARGVFWLGQLCISWLLMRDASFERWWTSQQNTPHPALNPVCRENARR